MPAPTDQGKQYGGPGHADVATITVQDMEDQSFFKCHAMPTVGYSKATNWASNDIVGRSVAIYGYQSSSGASVSLSIPIYGQIEASDGRAAEHVKEACDWFRSLSYPDYGDTPSGGKSSFLLKPPHRVLITIANWLTMICIVNNVSIDPEGDVWDVRTGLPMAARVNLSLSEISTSALGTKIPPGIADIRPIEPIA